MSYDHVEIKEDSWVLQNSYSPGQIGLPSSGICLKWQVIIWILHPKIFPSYFLLLFLIQHNDAAHAQTSLGWPHQAAKMPFVPKGTWRSEDVVMQILVPGSSKINTVGNERIRFFPFLMRLVGCFRLETIQRISHVVQREILPVITVTAFLS